MNNKKVISADLDGTLTPSKSALGPDMADVLCRILSKYKMAIVSGGAYKQFQKQFLSQLSCGQERLKNLSLFPTNGSMCYVYEDGDWKQLYAEMLSEEQRKDIISALEDAIKTASLDLSGAYGEIIEDRGSQVTFSGRGQEAPIEEKKAWDPDRSKRQAIVDIIKPKFPDLEIRINSVSSIDITRKGIDKAYAMNKIKELLQVSIEDIVFFGDALFEGGNDAAVKKTNVDSIQVSGPEECKTLLEQYL